VSALAATMSIAENAALRRRVGELERLVGQLSDASGRSRSQICQRCPAGLWGSPARPGLNGAALACAASYGLFVAILLARFAVVVQRAHSPPKSA
jgi:hypothetical protein